MLRLRIKQRERVRTLPKQPDDTDDRFFLDRSEAANSSPTANVPQLAQSQERDVDDDELEDDASTEQTDDDAASREAIIESLSHATWKDHYHATRDFVQDILGRSPANRHANPDGQPRGYIMLDTESVHENIKAFGNLILGLVLITLSMVLIAASLVLKANVNQWVERGLIIGFIGSVAIGRYLLLTGKFGLLNKLNKFISPVETWCAFIFTLLSLIGHMVMRQSPLTNIAAALGLFFLQVELFKIARFLRNYFAMMMTAFGIMMMAVQATIYFNGFLDRQANLPKFGFLIAAVLFGLSMMMQYATLAIAIALLRSDFIRIRDSKIFRLLD